jgi:hypothetical protein
MKSRNWIVRPSVNSPTVFWQECALKIIPRKPWDAKRDPISPLNNSSECLTRLVRPAGVEAIYNFSHHLEWNLIPSPRRSEILTELTPSPIRLHFHGSSVLNLTVCAAAGVMGTCTDMNTLPWRVINRDSNWEAPGMSSPHRTGSGLRGLGADSWEWEKFKQG